MQDWFFGGAPTYPLPFIPWVGGKRRLIRPVVERWGGEIQAFNPELIVSPFLGGGAVELALLDAFPEAVAALSDVNARLIRTWQGVMEDPERVYEIASAMDAAVGLDGAAVQHSTIRALLNQLSPGDMRAPEYAALLIWLVTRSFSALYRENSKGGLNAPVDRDKRRPLPDLDRLFRVRRAVSGAVLKCKTVGAMAHIHTKRELWVVDPPYVGTYGQYNKAGWLESDFLSLCKQIRELRYSGPARFLLFETTKVLPIIQDVFLNADVMVIQKKHTVNGRHASKCSEIVVWI